MNISRQMSWWLKRRNPCPKLIWTKRFWNLLRSYKDLRWSRFSNDIPFAEGWKFVGGRRDPDHHGHVCVRTGGLLFIMLTPGWGKRDEGSPALRSEGAECRLL